MTTPEGISNLAVYQQLAQLSAKLDVLIAQNADHEARLRLLEKSRWPLANIGALTGLAAIIVTVLVAAFGH